MPPSLPAILLPFATPRVVLDKGSVQLIDIMGDDAAIVQAARTSYNRGQSTHKWGAGLDALGRHRCNVCKLPERLDPNEVGLASDVAQARMNINLTSTVAGEFCLEGDRQLLRYMMRKGHTTPFEMCEIKVCLQVPMDTWRQVIRQRTANVNEYSTRYTEAIDEMAKTLPGAWRIQSDTNKQGSSGDVVTEWPKGYESPFTPLRMITADGHAKTPGEYLSAREAQFHTLARELYQERLAFGVAKEVARKDLPLSNYTRAYWKIDLLNLLKFLHKRLDTAAQQEIREYATALADIVKLWVPQAWEAFVDYQLEAASLSRLELNVLRDFIAAHRGEYVGLDGGLAAHLGGKLTREGASKREVADFLATLKLDGPA